MATPPQLLREMESSLLEAPWPSDRAVVLRFIIFEADAPTRSCGLTMEEELLPPADKLCRLWSLAERLEESAVRRIPTCCSFVKNIPLMSVKVTNNYNQVTLND